MSQMKFTDVGRGPAIIWIHGYPLSGEIFAPQTSIPGFRHIVPDLPGFGSSPASGTRATIDDFAGAIITLADDLVLTTFIVAGLSMGGYIALALVRKAAERITAVILLDTKETPDSEKARADRLSMIDKVEESGAAAAVESMLPKLLGAQTTISNPVLIQKSRRILESASAQGITSALSAMASRPDSTSIARSIRIPTLIIVGAEDTLTPPSDAERMHGLIRGSQLTVIPGAGHLTTLEQPELTSRTIQEFLAMNWTSS